MSGAKRCKALVNDAPPPSEQFSILFPIELSSNPLTSYGPK